MRGYLTERVNTRGFLLDFCVLEKDADIQGGISRKRDTFLPDHFGKIVKFVSEEFF